VALTPEGHEVLDKVMPGHIEVVQRLLLSSLSRKDVATITEILGRVRDRMRTAPPRSAAPRRSTRPTRSATAHRSAGAEEPASADRSAS
jgi:hypothetical protein